MPSRSTAAVSPSCADSGSISLAGGFTNADGKPGLEIQNGALTEFDFTLNSKLSLLGFTATAKNLQDCLTSRRIAP